MHVSIIAFGSWGDVRPAIALGLALREAGHGVRLVVTADFGQWVADDGLEVRLLPVNERALMKEVSSRTHPLQIMLSIHRRIAPALRRSGRELLSLANDTDVLLSNEWLLSAASGIAQQRNIKLVHIAMKPHVRSAERPISTMPPLPRWAPGQALYNRMTYRLGYLLRWWSYGRAENELRRDHLNLPALPPADYRRLFEQTPSVTLVSPLVAPRPADWEDHHRQTSFLYYDDPGWMPPPGLRAFLENGPAPVYIGFGSMHDRQPTATTQTLLRALAETNLRAVLYRGWADLGRLRLPADVYPLEYAPHSWLFPQMAAVVHHAGAGTTAAALRAGVPSVPIPHSGDQHYWARRLYQMGAGTEPLGRRRLRYQALVDRIRAAVEDPRLTARAQEIGIQIQKESNPQKTVAALEDLLSRSAPPHV